MREHHFSHRRSLGSISPGDAATIRAIEGCDLVYDCIGLPGDQVHLHPVTARNIAGTLRHTKALPFAGVGPAPGQCDMDSSGFLERKLIIEPHFTGRKSLL